MNLQHVLMTSAVALLIAGCASVPENKETTDSVKEESVVMNPGESAVSAPDVLAGKMAEAFAKEDSALFASLLTPEMRKRFPASDFEKTCRTLEQKLGRVTEFSFLIKLENPLLDVRVWKFHYERTVNGKTVKQDVLFRVITGTEKNGSSTILSFGFL